MAGQSGGESAWAVAAIVGRAAVREWPVDGGRAQAKPEPHSIETSAAWMRHSRFSIVSLDITMLGVQPINRQPVLAHPTIQRTRNASTHQVGMSTRRL
jgi:hypothetical protein